MSIITAVEAGWGKVAHAFVVGAATLKNVIITASKDLKAAQPEIAEVEAVANTIVQAIYPGAEVVAVGIEAVLDKAFAAVEAAGDAAAANGLSLTLDAATVAAIKAALPIVKAQAATTPGS